MRAAVDTLTARLDSHAQSGADSSVGDAVLELGVLIRRLQSVQARAADRFSVTGAFGCDGARHARAWLSGRSNESRGQVGVITRHHRPRA